MSTISKPSNQQLINYGGAGVGAGVGMYVGTKAGAKIGNSFLQDVAIASGAAAGGKVENVNPFVARVISSNAARTGKVGSFAARFPGLAAHVGGKVGSAATDASISGATEALGTTIGHGDAGKVVGQIINGVKHEAVSATTATVVGDGAGRSFAFAAKWGTGIALAGLGAYLVSQAIPN
jgi:hypothetical protein